MERELLLFSTIEPATVAQVDAWLGALEAASARVGIVRINSLGGSWHAGQLIRSRLLMSKVGITTVNEGVVGSAATLIYAAGKVRQCQPHAKFMMHRVSNDVGYTDEDGLTKALGAQRALNRSTAEMYADVTSVAADEWEKKMAAETWLKADEAKEIGFCTQVLAGNAALVVPDATMSGADLHGFYMSILSPQKEMKLEDVRNSLKLAGIDLPANATEADALAAIGKLKNQAAGPTPKTDEEDDEMTKLRKRLDTLEQGRVSEQATLIEGTVNSAIAAGKITASQKDTYTSILKADFTNGSKVLAEMTGRTPLSRRLPEQPKGQVDATRNDWDFEKWSREDSAGLRAMKSADPDKYQNLLDAYTS
jgi:ATP-dependent Clp protease protease subunit